MHYGSVCSGIEAATSAWHDLGWNPVFFSEIEKFPSSVLQYHYPDVPNLGDMTKFKEWPDAAINVLVGGTPCQSFSVAGLRKGLADPRGNLMLTYLAIAARYSPKWLVWENVPGVLSSNGGRDFGTFLGGLGQLGYGFAYRILDAQYFGVPQRRRRVFVVGCLGSWQRAASVLFERHSLSGNPPPSREKGQEVAGTIGSRTTGGGGLGTDFDCAGGLQAVHTTGAGFWQEGLGTLRAREQDSHENLLCMSTDQAGAEIGIGTTLNCNHEAPIICEPIGFEVNMSQQQPSTGNVFQTLTRGTRASVCNSMQVRRLTPMECERLQGFPYGYTNIMVKGKPAADGPRYKALGNSMAVPVMKWIGKRIQEVDAL